MLRRLSTLRGFSIRARDGDVGSVEDVYFDDRSWVTRYLVIDAGYGLQDRTVLISPFAVTAIDWYHDRVLVELTRRHLQSSPQIEIEMPIWRRQEEAYLDYYGYPRYWTGTQPWGKLPSPCTRAPRSRHSKAGRVARKAYAQAPDSRLRSGNAVFGCRVEAADGLIGHVADLVQDELTWSLRYLVVNAHSWLPGRHLLVSTQWLEAVSWDLRALFVGLDREAIRSSPAWQAEDWLTHDHEQSLLEHDGCARGEASPGEGNYEERS